MQDHGVGLGGLHENTNDVFDAYGSVDGAHGALWGEARGRDATGPCWKLRMAACAAASSAPNLKGSYS